MRSVFISLALSVVLVAFPAFADPVAISSYDITDAIQSGFGGWAHNYSGTITPLRDFTAGTNSGTVANYSGGSGTLNDAVIGATIVNTQLFVQGDLAGGTAPVITLKLAAPVTVSKIDLYGGNIEFNIFPGAITGVTVEIGGQSAAITTVPFGGLTILGIPFNDTIDLTGTPLAAISTDTIVLRDFVVSPITGGQFTLTEIQVDGVAGRAFTAFLHGSGSALFLDGNAPTAATPKFKDSSRLTSGGGNPWREIGIWSGSPAFSSGALNELTSFHAWLGLKNSDDIGTRFDLRAEVLKNNSLATSGEIFCITGVTRNHNLAKEAIGSFAPFEPIEFDGITDVLSLRVLTRIGTNGAGVSCGGHSNAVGLRLYFDAVSRSSRFDGAFAD